MPSCLGIYTDKNIIKYAKVTSTSNKVGSQIKLDAYGVKFYDNIQTAVQEIARELECEGEPIALTLTNEDYFNTEIFSNLKKKDMQDLIMADYLDKKGLPGSQASITDLRYKLAKNSGIPDKAIAVCVASSKGELANIRSSYEEYNINSISPLPVSIKNLFENQAIDEEAAVINIEDKTTITVFHKNEIQHLASISIGTEEIVSKLAEKYNSTAKAYEALKKVSAYIEDTYDADSETRDILAIVIPVLYEIRQQSEDVLLPYLKELDKIYITGTGAVINNLDLYFKDVFIENECEILRPFFISRDNSNVKEIMEANSAIALALDGLGMADSDLNFNSAAKKAAGNTAAKEVLKKGKDIISTVKTKINDIITNLNAPIGSKKRRSRKRRNVSFDDGIVAKQSTETENTDIDIIPGFGRIDVWLRSLAVFCIALAVVYAVFSNVIAGKISDKNSETMVEISKVEAAIATASGDASYLRTQADQYVVITEKLATILAKISAKQQRKTFNIPNFLSKLMFIIPANVRVTAIDIDNSGNVKINAESGQYAQLGYLVSRLKLERALYNVDMEVQNVSSNIKILVSGVLP